MRRPYVLTVILVFLTLGGSSAASLGGEKSVRIDAGAIDREVRALLDEHGSGIVAGIWVGGVEAEPWYEWKSGATYPTASAIKTAYLVELFAAHSANLDDPLPGLAGILGDDEHPALAPFRPETRVEIRRELADASARRVGEIMMGKRKATNAVYNAAANVTTAVLGGPDSLAAKIHAREPEFAPIQPRRYMLAPRDRPGDNEASAAALAAVLRHIASGQLRGVDGTTLAAVRGAIIQNVDPDLGTHYSKGGSLNSDPITRVQSGWWETKGGPIVYVVMTSQPGPGDRSRDQEGERLARTAERLTATVLTPARAALAAP